MSPEKSTAASVDSDWQGQFPSTVFFDLVNSTEPLWTRTWLLPSSSPSRELSRAYCGRHTPGRNWKLAPPATARIRISCKAITVDAPIFIRHVALNTGHVRDSRHNEIDLEVKAALRPLIAEACAGKRAQAVAIPAVAGHSFTARCSGRSMTASVYAAGSPLVRLCPIAVAGHSRFAAPARRALHAPALMPPATDPARVPPEPWFGVLLTAAVEDDPSVLTWIGDFVHCHIFWRNHDVSGEQSIGWWL